MTSPDGLPPDRDRFSPIGPLLLGFAALDFLAPVFVRHSDSPIMASLLAGTMTAQGALLAIWAVLGPQRWIVRLPASFLAALALFGALTLAFAMSYPGPAEWDELAQSLVMLPILLLAAQAPLWVVRLVFGCRIAPTGAETGRSPKELRQFGMEHLLGAMAIVALALGLASLGLRDSSVGQIDLEVWAFLAVACLFCFVWSMFSTLPCLWAAFVARNKAGGAWALAAYTAVMTTVLMVFIVVVVGEHPPAEAVFGLFAFHVALVGVMFGTLHVVRVCGYVLVRAKRMRPAAAPAVSATPAEPPSPTPPAEDAPDA